MEKVYPAHRNRGGSGASGIADGLLCTHQIWDEDASNSADPVGYCDGMQHVRPALKWLDDLKQESGVSE